MPARTRKISLTDSWKAKIRASMLLNRLQDHAIGKVDMKSTQVKAADIVLRKMVPDLARTEMVGDGGGPLTVEIVRFGANPPTP